MFLAANPAPTRALVQHQRALADQAGSSSQGQSGTPVDRNGVASGSDRGHVEEQTSRPK